MTDDLISRQVAWTYIWELRSRGDADSIEAQDAFSGRWRLVTNSYWDDCVIPVKWRRSM